ncbi:MAG: carbohydrate binding domain-containing protein, partial [Planctomycetota bacterium]
MTTRLEAAENLLVNPGFEDGLVEPWNTYGGVATEVVRELAGAVVPEDPIEGDFCVHVVVPAAGANFWDSGLQHTGHVFEAGKKYTLSAFLKCRRGTLQINFKPELGQDPWTGYGEQSFTMTEEWAEYSTTTDIFTEDVSPANITFHIAYTAGDFWIDDVRFYEGDYVPAEFAKSELASNPDPVDGGMCYDTWARLTWEPGDTAASHDVYFGDDFEDVSDGTGGTFLANRRTTTLDVGSPGSPHP